MIKNIWDLKAIRFNRLIEDPFPEHSNWARNQGWFGVNPLETAPPEISIWAAYRMGYEKAYKEIEAALPRD